jgi:hypothetical protein
MGVQPSLLRRELKRTNEKGTTQVVFSGGKQSITEWAGRFVSEAGRSLDALASPPVLNILFRASGPDQEAKGL